MKITLALLILGLALGANASNATEEVTTTDSGATDGGATDGMATSGGGNETAATTAEPEPKVQAKVKFELSEEWSEDFAEMDSEAAVLLAGQITDALDTYYESIASSYIRSEVTAFRQASAKRMRRTPSTTEADVEIYFSEEVTQADVQDSMDTLAAGSDLVTGSTVSEVAEVSGARLLVASALALILPVIARAL